MASSSKEPEVFCKECRVSFPSHAAYSAHCKRKMKEGNGHVHCELCGTEFVRRETLARHHKQEHAHEQDLDCPGCGLHFTRVGGLISHIESNNCLRIGKGAIVAGRWERSKMGKDLALKDGKDPKEYYGRYLPVSESVVDGPYSALGASRRFLGHMIQHNGPDDAAPSTISVKGRHEAPTVSVQVECLETRRSRGPDLRPGSLAAVEFPTPAEAAASKKQAGSQGQKPDLPYASTKGRVLETRSLPGAVNAQHTPVADFRPGSLVASEFPTPAEAGVIKGHTDHKVSKDSLPSAPTTGERVKKEASVDRVKTLADSRWAPKTTIYVSPRPSYSRGFDLLGGDTPKLYVKHGQASNTNSPPNTCEATEASPHEHHYQQRSYLLSDAQQSPSKEEGAKADQSRFSRGQSLHTPEASVRTTEVSGIFSDRSGHDKYATDDMKTSIPPHLRGKIQEVPVSPNNGSTKNTSSVSGVMPNPRGGLDHVATTSNAATYTSANPASDMPTGRSIVDGGDSESEFESTEPLRAREHSRIAHGNVSLPPHLRGKLGHSIPILPKVTETEDTPSPSVSTGQASLEPAGTENQPATDQPSQLRDNFGVAPIIKSYAVVTKTSENLPPHLRQRQGGHSMLPAGRDVTKGNTAESAMTSPNPTDQVPMNAEASSLGLQNSSVTATEPGTDVSVRMKAEVEDIGLGRHDPEHPNFNPQSYYCRYTKRYQCPIGTCAKLFKSLQGITGHLGSDVHKRPHMNLQCPHCLKYFKSTAALTQHTESQGRRCVIRDTTEYRPFVDQLTGGIADLEGVHDDMTNRYIVTKWAIDLYGDPDNQERAMRALEQQKMREIGEKEGDYWAGKTIGW